MHSENMKKRTTLYIEAELIEKAKELGLNVSKICENALKEAIKRMENADCQEKGGIGTVGSDWWAGPDLNRRPSPRQVDNQPPPRTAHIFP